MPDGPPLHSKYTFSRCEFSRLSSSTKECTSFFSFLSHKVNSKGNHRLFVGTPGLIVNSVNSVRRELCRYRKAPSGLWLFIKQNCGERLGNSFPYVVMRRPSPAVEFLNKEGSGRFRVVRSARRFRGDEARPLHFPCSRLLSLDCPRRTS